MVYRYTLFIKLAYTMLILGIPFDSPEIMIIA
jgi:hypothetical protein